MKVVDLSHPLHPDTPVLEGDPAVVLKRVRFHEHDGYQVTSICFGSHSGTHVDAPRHFFPQGLTLDGFPVDRFVRRGWVVDVRPPEAAPPRPHSPARESPPRVAGAPPPTPARVEAELLARQLRDVRLEPGDFLLLWTGGAPLSDDAVPLLLESGAGLVGTDSYSLDDPPYPAHRLLLGADVLLAENLANLERLGPGRVMCAFLPLLWLHADGSPMRAVAWREE